MTIVPLLLPVLVLAIGGRAQESAARPPNVVLIVADDLGWNELGCQGQERIRTPHLDRMAADGMRFSDFYSAAPVCAPARCMLLTGRHAGHALIRDNREVGGWEQDDPEGQLPLPAGTVTLPRLLQQHGYATACVGKWGLGGPGSTGMPDRQGFDLFFGYLCQKRAHNYYPTHLWRNGERVVLEGNSWKNLTGPHYAPDLMLRETLGWLKASRGRPFFLFYASPIPHLALQIPDEELAAYDDAFEDPPYDGRRGYLPHPRPRACYAAMISRLDREVGDLLACLREIGVEDETLVLFTSDNGATYTGGADTTFFRSNAPFSGRKGQLREGGIRVPALARWPGRIRAGTVSDHVAAGYDIMPTVLAAAGVPAPADLDGISFLPTLLGRGDQPAHDHLYWEFPAYGHQQAIRMGRWKALREDMRRGPVRTQLFDLASDLAEQHDLAASEPEVLARIEALFRTARTPSAEFPFPALDQADDGGRGR